MPRSVSLALVLTFVLTLTPASAQPFTIEEAVSGGGPSADTGEGVALADDGSRYVVGTFEGTATFGDVSVTSAGDSDIFLVKYDADLDAVWARRAGTDVFNDFGESVAVGPDGSVYATGFFTGIATWDGGENPDVELTTFSDFDVFVAKYTPEGNLEWVRQAGGVGQDTGRDVAVDADGNAYLVGGFEGVGTFGDVTLTSAGSSDAFLVKYDPEGDVVWARRGGSDQGDIAYGVAVTDDGAAHVSGSFRGVAQFGGLPIQSAGQTDVFVVQYDASGEPVWLEGIGADGSEFTRGGGIGLGPDDAVYVTGSFSNTILVGTDVLASTGFTDVFVAKLSGEGDELWGRRGGGDGTNFSAALALDASGNVLTTGYIDGTGTFADEPITTQGRDGYLAVLDSDGGLVTVELLGGTGQDAGTGVAVSDATARFAATGSFRGTATFGDLDLTSAGSSDVYLIGGPAAGDPVPSTLFVDADATGAETGLSWADAFTDLQDALATADTLDADSLAIWVAEGTYYPTDNDDPTASFELIGGVALYGGFDGTESMLDQRDWATHLVKLSGDLGTPNDFADNSHAIVRATNSSELMILDGFVIEGATGEEVTGVGTFDTGLGLLATGGTSQDSTIIRNCLFQSNAGIGIGIYGGSPQGATLGIYDSRFQGNHTALWNDGERVVAEDTEWIQNATGLRAFGGSTRLKRAYFLHNATHARSVLDSRLYISETVFRRNGAVDIPNIGSFPAGGVVSAFDSELIITNTRFEGNSSGSPITLQFGSLLDAANLIFVGNDGGSSGTIFTQESSATLINVTAVTNNGSEAGTLFLLEGSAIGVSNSILWENGVRVYDAEAGSSISFAYNIMDGGCIPLKEITCDTIVDESPHFVREPSPGPDEEWGTEDDDYGDLRLQEDSPAVDFGLTEFLPPDALDLDEDGDTEELLPVDLDGNPRVQGNEVDLGAYESPFAVALEPGAGVPAANVLEAAYPNPFRDRTTLALDVAAAQDVTVEVFDVLGRRVATVHDGPLDVGEHRVVIEADGLPAGVYVVRAEGEAFRFTQRVTLVR